MTSKDSPPEKRRRSDRRSFRPFRNWVLRPVLWILVLLVVLVGVGLLVLRLDVTQERLRGIAEGRISTALDRPVTVGSLGLDLFPPAVVARDVVLAGPNPGDPPVARIEQIAIAARLEPLRRSVLDLERIEVTGADLFIDLEPENTNLPTFAGGEGESPLEVRIGRLVLADSRLHLADATLPLDLDAREVRGRLDGADSTGRYGVRLTAQSLRALTLPGATNRRESDTEAPKPLAETGFVARGTLGAEGLEIDRLRLTAADLDARGEGQMRWGGDAWLVELDLQIAAAAEWANRLGYLAEPVSGAVEWTGDLRADPAGWLLDGDVTAPRFSYDRFAFGDVSLAAEGDAAGWRFEDLRAGFAGGGINGRVEVNGLDGSRGPGGETFALDLSYRRVDVRRFLAALDAEVEGLAGQMSGTLRYGSSLADPTGGEGMGAVEFSSGSRAAGLALAGGGDFAIRRGVVETSRLETDLGSSKISGDIRYDLGQRQGLLDLSADVGDAGEWYRLLSSDPDAVWAWSGGAGEIAADLTVDGDRTDMALQIDVRDLDTEVRRLDRLRGTLALELGPASDGTLDIDLTGEADGGELRAFGDLPTGDRPVDLQIATEGWSVDGLETLIPGLPAPLGRIDSAMDLAGPWEALSAEGVLTSPSLEIAGIPLGESRFEGAWGAEALSVVALSVSPPAGLLRAEGRWDRLSGALRGSFEAPGLYLSKAPLDALSAGSQMFGQVSATGTLNGTVEKPELIVSMQSEAVKVGRSELVPSAFDLTWRGGRLDVSGSALGLMEIEGGGRLEPEDVDLSFEVTSEQLLDTLRFAGVDLPALSGVYGGTVTVRASADSELDARLTLDRFRAEYQDRELVAVEPIAVRWIDGALEIDSFFVEESGGGGELFVAGTVDFAPAAEGSTDTAVEPRLDLNVQSSLSARWMRLVVPTLRADGTLNLLATARGPVSAPRLNGLGELNGGRLLVTGFPHSLDQLDLRLLFDPGVITLDRMTGVLGGGDVRAAGQLDFDALMAGDLDYRFQARIRDATLRYPEGFVVRGDATLVAGPVAGGTEIGGTVDLRRAFYLEDVPVSLPRLLQQMLQRDRVEVAETDETLESILLSINIRGPEALRVRNNIADLRGDVDLVLRGTAALPVVTGLVDVTRGGTLRNGDVEYEVERGRLTFNSLYQIDPVIDLEATAEVAGHDVTLQLSGTIERLETELTSEPPLTQVEILSLLATGRRPEGGDIFGSSRTEDSGAGVETFLYGQAASVLGQRVNSLFGIDRFRVNPVASAEGGSALSFTVGKQISKDLFLTYTSDPATDLDYRLQVEWQLSDAVTVVLTQDGDDTYAVDLRLEHRF